MATPLIPSYTTLTTSTFTPKAIIDDSNFEAWLFDNYTQNSAIAMGRVGFILKLIQAYRAGLPSVSYVFASVEDATYMRDKLETPVNQNGYGYAGKVEIPGGTSPGARTLVVTLV